MAHHQSAKKRIRQIKRRTEVNRGRVGRIRTSLRKVEDAIASGNREDALTAFRAAQPQMMRGVRRGVAHRNTVSRKLSRLSARIKAMSA
jgi:small subunit ribosomal protein S20